MNGVNTAPAKEEPRGMKRKRDELEVVALSATDEVPRNSVFFMFKNVSVENLQDWESQFTEVITLQNKEPSWVDKYGPSEFRMIPWERVFVRQTKEEALEKKRMYNAERNKREDVKAKRKEKMNTPEAKAKRERLSKDPKYLEHKRETAKLLRRTTREIKKMFPEEWQNVRKRLKTEHYQKDISMDDISTIEEPSKMETEVSSSTESETETTEEMIQ